MRCLIFGIICFLPPLKFRGVGWHTKGLAFKVTFYVRRGVVEKCKHIFSLVKELK